MAKSTKYLLVGSTQAYSGKSATIVGVAHQLQQQGVTIGYGKPLGNLEGDRTSGKEETDVSFLTQALDLPTNRVHSPLVSLSTEAIGQYLKGETQTNYSVSLEEYVRQIDGDLVFLEGPGNLYEGNLFNLSVARIAEVVDASILLVARYHTQTLVDELLSVQTQLGKSLLGVVINDVPIEQLATIADLERPFLENQGIAVLGILPRDSLLRSVSVRELSKKLDAQVLCRADRLDLMVESLTIGAMNVNSALEYFRQGRNMAVVTGGDRRDLQMAALETSTNCLILTGHASPHPDVISRAEDLEVPILSVDLDTLTTVEIADYAFGQARLQEPIKVNRVQELMSKNFDVERLMELLDIKPGVAA